MSTCREMRPVAGTKPRDPAQSSVGAKPRPFALSRTILFAIACCITWILYCTQNLESHFLPRRPLGLESSVECIGPEYNRTCKFHNLYWLTYIDGDFNYTGFMMLLLQSTSDELPQYAIHLANKYYWPWGPERLVFGSEQEIQGFLGTHYYEHHRGVSLLFQPLYPHNIGHALFDGLYPAFVALLKFGLHDQPFRPIAVVDQDCLSKVVGGTEREETTVVPGGLVDAYLPDPSRPSKHSVHTAEVHLLALDPKAIVELKDGRSISIPREWIVRPKRKGCMAENIFQRFGDGGGKMMRYFEMEQASAANPDLLMRFETVIAGQQNVGNMVMESSGALAGSSPPMYGTALMRERMMRVYNAQPKYPRAGFGRGNTSMHFPLPQGEVIQAIVIDNKRFTDEDRIVLKSAIQQWNKGSDGAVNASYIEWPSVGTFEDHMQLVSRTHIYISAPGTALQYVPFMNDGGVFVALGSPMKRYGRIVPCYVEQQLAGGGTPYLKTLYYDSVKMMKLTDGYGQFLDESELLSLFRKAQQLIQNGIHLPVSVDDNLSAEGRLMRELCNADPPTCELLYKQQNALTDPKIKYCVYDNWLELIVYEVGGFAEQGYEGDKCALNRTELRRLRVKYQLPHYGIPGLT